MPKINPNKLTKRQKEILDFVRGYQKLNEYSPSYQEIADEFSLASLATVHQHIQTLQDKGYIKKGFGESRSIELEPADDEIVIEEVVNLPLMGLIAAGQPIEAVMTGEMIAVPANLVVHRLNSYVLQVKGDSMIEDGILDGDFVVVERNPSPADGDTVVALLDNAYATLKKFFREHDRIRLQPANKKLKPIYVRDPLIQGVVRAVIRNFKKV